MAIVQERVEEENQSGQAIQADAAAGEIDPILALSMEMDVAQESSGAKTPTPSNVEVELAPPSPKLTSEDQATEVASGMSRESAFMRNVPG
jgi:hypothetical protein